MARTDGARWEFGGVGVGADGCSLTRSHGRTHTRRRLRPGGPRQRGQGLIHDGPTVHASPFQLCLFLRPPIRRPPLPLPGSSARYRTASCQLPVPLPCAVRASKRTVCVLCMWHTGAFAAAAPTPAARRAPLTSQRPGRGRAGMHIGVAPLPIDRTGVARRRANDGLLTARGSWCFKASPSGPLEFDSAQKRRPRRPQRPRQQIGGLSSMAGRVSARQHRCPCELRCPGACALAHDGGEYPPCEK